MLEGRSGSRKLFNSRPRTKTQVSLPPRAGLVDILRRRDRAADPVSAPACPMPLRSAHRMLVFANRRHAKNFSPDVEAPGKINREGIENCGETTSISSDLVLLAPVCTDMGVGRIPRTSCRPLSHTD